MIRSIKLWAKVAAFAVTIAAVLEIAALAMRVSPAWQFATGLAIAVSMLTTFFCMFVGIAVSQLPIGRRDPPNMSIRDELEQRKLSAKGPRIQLR